jgi:hypothetical protein
MKPLLGRVPPRVGEQRSPCVKVARGPKSAPSARRVSRTAPGGTRWDPRGVQPYWRKSAARTASARLPGRTSNRRAAGGGDPECRAATAIPGERRHGPTASGAEAPDAHWYTGNPQCSSRRCSARPSATRAASATRATWPNRSSTASRRKSTSRAGAPPRPACSACAHRTRYTPSAAPPIFRQNSVRRPGD